MRRGGYMLGVLVAGCASAGDVQPDSAPIGDAGCTPQTWFPDVDGDGHGDAAAALVACEQPVQTVTISDDCDDADPARFPGAAEICDGNDNDCDSATGEVCPAGCAPIRRPPPDAGKVYLFCSGGASFVTARSICAGAGYTLVQIDDAAENAFVRTTANSLLGAVDLHLGGSDATSEGTWVWDGGEPFWSGGGNGLAIGGRFVAWQSGEPNDDGTEDCAEMKPNGGWNDSGCGDARRFVCRR